MRHRKSMRMVCRVIPVAAVYLAASVAPAQQCCPPSPCAPSPLVTPAPTISAPGAPMPPGYTGPTDRTAPGTTEPGMAAPETGAGTFGGLSSGAGVGSSVALGSPGGYIDDAIPQTLFRLRNDAEWGINRFDRATFMFDTWREGSFHPHAFVNDGSIHGLFFDPKAQGTQIINDRVRLDELSNYLEVAFSPRFSAFVDLPIRFVHLGPNIEDVGEPPAERVRFPEVGEIPNANQNPNGVSDTIAGFKYAFIEDPNNRYVTFQFRTYFPTGDPGLALGTGHYTLEPGLLAYQRLSDRLVAQAEFMDWIPISGGNGAGSVLTYGFGIGYDVFQRPRLRITPVAEVVGWTVLGGTEAVNGTVPGPTTTETVTVNGKPTPVTGVLVDGVLVPPDHFFQSASGDTIVNVKFGVRSYFGDHSDFYIGWGHAVTGSRWYEDIIRAEYRLRF